MSRDITICGVFKGKLEPLSPESISESIFTLGQLPYDEWEDNGLVELISYRSKAVGFAIAQIVNHLVEHRYEAIEGVDIRRTFGVNSMVLSKDQLIALLQWLELIGRAMAQRAGIMPYTEEGLSHPLWIHALTLSQNDDFSGDEFDHFPLEAERFRTWRAEIEKATFDTFYWEESY